MNLANWLMKLRAVQAPSEYLARWLPETISPRELLCTTCNHVGHPQRQMAGRADIELAVWVILMGLGVVYVADWIILHYWQPWVLQKLFKLTSMAGKVFCVLSFAYTLLRVSIRNNTCPKCGGMELIPLDTPRAKSLLGSK
jgi:hypothetical protein